jgi:hypothetical protein
MSEHPPREHEQAADEEKWPIGFLIIITLVALYLGWRLIQGIIWLLDLFWR